MVVGGEEHHLGKAIEPIVERGDRLQVEMVGGLVENEGIGAGEHHLGEHAAHPLAAGENRRLLQRLLAGKEHLA